MHRIKVKQNDQTSHRTVEEAAAQFMRHCQLKNLAAYTLKYYEENLNFFQTNFPDVKKLNDITQETIEKYVGILMDKGDKITAINPRLRGIFVFLRFCFDKEWMEPFPLSQL